MSELLRASEARAATTSWSSKVGCAPRWAVLSTKHGMQFRMMVVVVQQGPQEQACDPTAVLRRRMA